MHLDQVDDSDFRNLQSPHNRENWEETHFAGVKDGKGCTGGSPGQKVTGRTGVRAKTGSWHLRTETKVKFLFLSSLALGIDGIVLAAGEGMSGFSSHSFHQNRMYFSSHSFTL